MTETTTRLGQLRRPLLVAYFAVFIWSIIVNGIPIDRIAVLLWMLAVFLVGSLGRTRDQVVEMVRDWIGLVVIYMIYDYSRGTADQWGIGINKTALRDIDRFLGFGQDPNVYMQNRFYKRGAVRWYDVFGSIIYMMHFVLPVIPLAMLRMRNRPEWIRYVRRFTLTLSIAIFGFIVFPATPPWMASRDGDLDPVVRLAGRGWSVLHLKTVSKTLDRGAAVLNAVAPMPSLHAGMALLVALWFTRNKPTWVRVLALGFPFIMTVTLVYFGEHYIIDAFAGWAITLAAWGIANWWEKRRSMPETEPPDVIQQLG